MTDTPRTQAELLSIFADQQDHGITAQDMRDLVVSIGGLPKAIIAKRQNNAGITTGLYDPYSKGAVTQIGGGNDLIVDWSGSSSTAFYDPNAWLNTSPIADTEYWGDGVAPWPVGTVLTLPPGMFIWELFVQTASGLGSGFVEPYMDWINNPETFYPASAMVTAHPTLGDGAASPANQTGETLFFGHGGWVADVETHMIASLFATCPLAGVKWVTMTVARSG